MYKLKDLEPYKIFKYFEEISMIPRASGKEEGVANYLVNFAKERNLWVHKDNSNNVIIKKSATEGYENSKGVIIQGHTDMVAEKNCDSEHDFNKDSLNLYIDGDYIKAKGTTLGADNGIAIAMSLALLDSNEYKHPNIEALFTAEEETTMRGAMTFDEKLLDNKILLNIDSEEEGIFLASCAGGAKQIIDLDINYEKVPENFETYKIKVRGLCGGHSGSDIHKGFANANKLMGRILKKLSGYNIYISFIEGGAKENAIPRECDCIISVDKKYTEEMLNLTSNIEKILKKEYKNTEKNLSIFLEKIEKEEKCFSKDITEKIISIIMLSPNGVNSMSLDIEGLVESSNNLGVIKTIKDKMIQFIYSTRSSILTKKEYLIDIIQQEAYAFCARHTVTSQYPAWEYNKTSFIREIFLKTYKNMYNKEAKIDAIHAGLECGIISQKIPNVDIISFGPNIYGAHTPNERLSISSTKRVWEFLIKVLEELK